MTVDFKLKAQKYEEMLTAPDGEATTSGAGPIAWLEAYRQENMLKQEMESEAAPLPGMVALMVMKANATKKGATMGEAFIDRTVQFGQPYPAITHVELWVGDRVDEKSEDNHFSTYLGAEKGALWTSGMTDSKKFYSNAAWSAVPIFAADAERRVRSVCNLHCGTPYPRAAVLWQYPMSTWPLRAFAGMLDDGINAPAHCAALSARVLRSAIPEVAALPQSSHWYGPSSLYLEVAKPERMEAAFASQRPVVRAQVQDDRDDELAARITLHSDDEVVAMSQSDARQALHALAIQVTRAGSRQGGAEVDQDLFRESQELFARGLTRYTWLNRKRNER